MKEYYKIAIFFLAFAALTAVGDLFVFLPHSTQSVFFPATGLSIAMLLITDFRKWAPYIISIFIASVAVSYFENHTIVFCLIWSALTTIEALVAAYLIKKITGTDFSLERLKDFTVLILIGAFLTPAIFSFIPAYINVQWYGETSFWLSYLSWGAGKGIGLLVFAPLVLAWVDVSIKWKNLRQWMELAAVLILITIFSFMVFGINYNQKVFGFDMEMFFFIFPLAFWIAYRFGLRGITMASVIVNGIAIYYTTRYLGPFAFHEAIPLENIFHLQAFLAFITLAPLEIALVIGERRVGKMQLQEVIDNSPIIFFAKDLDGKYIFINKKYEQFFNIANEKIIGKTDYEIFPKELADSLSENDKLVAKKNESFTYEKIIVENDNPYTFMVTMFPLKQDKGGPYAVGGIATDITGFKQAEERFKLVVDSAPYAMLLIDQEEKIIMANPQTEKIFGYRKEELIGQSIELLVPERFRAKHPALVKAYLDKPVARPMGGGRELYGIRKDGSEMSLEISLSPIKTEKGIIILTSIIDISSRKSTTEALRLSERRFSYVLAATQDSIYDWELDKGKLWRNEQYEKIFDGPTASSDPDWWAKKIHPDDFENVNKNLQETYKNHEQIWNHEFRFKRVDGGYADVIDRGYIIYQDGKPVRMIGAIMDITERKKAEDQIHKSEERFRMFSELSSEAIVIHDQGIIVEVNDALKKMYGYEEDEVIGKSVLMLAAPESAELIRKNMVLKFGYPYEAVGLKKDGGLFYGEIQRRDIFHKGKMLRLVTIRDVSERKKAEETEKKRVAKIFERQGALLKLTSLETKLTLQEKLKKIIETDAKTTEVERVSICFFNKENTILETELIYKWSKNEYLVGFSFPKKEYPRFYQEISYNRIIDANDAQHDPRTNELLHDYLLPYEINSMLIAPFTLNGNVAGVIIHGHTGSKRIWTYDELYFASSLSTIVSLALENDEREKTATELKKINESLESRVIERTAELAANMKKYQIVTESAQEAIISINNLGIITFWNKAAEKIFGYSEKEAIGKDLSIIISPVDFEKHNEGIKRFISTGEPKMIGKGAFEMTAIKKGGENIPVELSLQYNKENGNIIFTGILRDITERKKLEVEQDVLFKMSNDMIGIAGANGVFKRINPAFGKNLGYTDEEFLSRPFIEFVHPDDKEATLKEVEKLSKGITTISFVNRYKTKSGTYKWLEWNAAPKGGELLAVAKDISACKEAGQQGTKQEEAIQKDKIEQS